MNELETKNGLTAIADKGGWEVEPVKFDESPVVVNVRLMQDVFRIATIFSQCDLVPACYRGGDKSVGRANCFAALSLGFELGIAPMQALTHIVVVNGRPAIDGQLAIALANRRAPIAGSIQYTEGGKDDEMYCEAWAIHKVTKEKHSYRMTIKDAKDAGWFSKNGSLWPKIPKLMLRYRAASYLIRSNFPDATMGLITIEEMQDVENAKTETKTAEVTARLESKIEE